jgi:aryl-alcohol dehydrogenase-like predicted oxidoreductase
MTFGTADETSFMHRATIDEEASFRVLDHALAAGVNFIDTADVYGQDGLSERVVGRWLADRGCRGRIVLATKFRRRTGPHPNDVGASRYHIRQAVEASLRRLQTDRIDLYQVHAQDGGTPEEETLRALDDLVTQGKVLYLGVCNYAAHRLVRSLWISDVLGLERYAVLQAQYNLLVREIEREHAPACLEHGVGITTWAPLAAGFLTGVYRPGEPPPAGSRLAVNQRRWRELASERNWAILAEVERVAAELGARPAQVALAWVLARPGVSACLVGVRSEAQLEENLGAVELRLSDEQMERLTAVSEFSHGAIYDMIARVEAL